MALTTAALRLWAKYDHGREESPFHPLVCHLLDVSHVVLALWSHGLNSGVRAEMAEKLACEEAAAGKLIALLAGLHDLGKASPPFQDKRPEAVPELERLGLHFPRRTPEVHHSAIGAHVLHEVLASEEFGLAVPAHTAWQLASALAGHHGTFPRSDDVLALGRRSLGDGPWAEARHELAAELANRLGATDLLALRDLHLDGAFLMMLAGITSVADWIGSDENHFPYAGTDIELDDYCRESHRRATKAVDELGLTNPAPTDANAQFTELFPFAQAPNELQRRTISYTQALQEPTILLIEAPMGGGKTEAALYAAYREMARLGEQGFYIALPTQATANAMFDRVREFLDAMDTQGKTNLRLVHGQAMLCEAFEKLRLAPVYDEGADDRGRVVAEAWFAPKKRALLASFGVGTIDQALLAVLQTRHSFVRLFGLAHKTIIFDEVHAYDTYMSTLLDHLLRWLAALKCSVVLLSATLPSDRRRKLLEAYAGSTGQPIPEARYPRMAWASTSDRGVVALRAERRGTIRVQWISSDISELAVALSETLANGGCAAVICNTVARAQETYRELAASQLFTDAELDLFHARFPFGEREIRERRTLDRFGKNGTRPRAAVLVATQVIEQSLDLDFDLMVTDLAPVDLVLQRAGRVHRHPETGRPAGLREPNLWILSPGNDTTDAPNFGDSEYIYERSILLRSYLALRSRDRIAIPGDIEGLVEEVYSQQPVAGPLSEAWDDTLQAADAEASRKRQKDARIARRVLIGGPEDAEELIEAFNQQLEEDENPAIHETLRAATRLGRPSVALVCLHRTSTGLSLDAAGTELVELERAADLEQTKRLLRNAVSVSHPAIVRHFARAATPAGWKQVALLRFHRPAIFTNGTLEEKGFSIQLDPGLGLIVHTRQREGEQTS